MCTSNHSSSRLIVKYTSTKMTHIKVCVALICFVVAASATPTDSTFWKGTFLDSTVEEMRSMCSNDDPIACIKFKVMTFLDNLFKKDNYKISDDVEVSRNSYSINEIDSGRSDSSLEQNVEKYIQTHDVTFNFPILDSKVTVAARNLEENEVDLKLKFGGGVEARKSKLKKILVPILVFVLLKAITLIPLALGVLGLKAWNALQLSFFSFVVSVSLAIFQLCKKIAADNAHPQISAHNPWEQYSHYARSLGDDAQEKAYSAYVN